MDPGVLGLGPKICTRQVLVPRECAECTFSVMIPRRVSLLPNPRTNI